MFQFTDPVDNTKGISSHCLLIAGDGFYISTSLYKIHYKELVCWPIFIHPFLPNHIKPLKKNLSKEMPEYIVSHVIHGLST